MTAIGAMFLDAYRELNARRMFWITMILSALAVSLMLIIDITPAGKLKFAWWEAPFPVPPDFDLAKLLKATFVGVGLSFWLTWAATILAVISTASLFPDFVSGGAIELVLAKPIGRVRLFALKYLGGLLFVALQVTVFTLASFLIIGFRAGVWEPGLFYAVPLVVIFFSYLFSVCTLTGVVTRSTIASLLVTLLFWVMLFGLNATDNLLMMPHVMSEVYVERLQVKLDSARQQDPPSEVRISALQGQLDEATTDLAKWRKWHGLILGVKTALPKTAETVKLMERRLVEAAHLPEMEENESEQQMPFMTPHMRAAGVRLSEVVERMDRTYRNRSVWWILGTSLAFELVVLIAACIVFVRRDY